MSEEPKEENEEAVPARLALADAIMVGIRAREKAKRAWDDWTDEDRQQEKEAIAKI